MDCKADERKEPKTLEACTKLCQASHACTAVEWFPKSNGYRNVKCHLFPGTPGHGGGSSCKNEDIVGGAKWNDAQCYVKQQGNASVIATVTLTLTLRLTVLHTLVDIKLFLC